MSYQTADSGDGRGARAIDFDEASVVRRIFKEFADRKSAEAIARLRPASMSPTMKARLVELKDEREKRRCSRSARRSQATKKPSAARPSEGQLSVVAGARYQRYLPDLKCRLRSAEPSMRAAFNMAFEP